MSEPEFYTHPFRVKIPNEPTMHRVDINIVPIKPLPPQDAHLADKAVRRLAVEMTGDYERDKESLEHLADAALRTLYPDGAGKE